MNLNDLPYWEVFYFQIIFCTIMDITGIIIITQNNIKLRFRWKNKAKE
jgi:hypothetical protein